ncbi:FK506-binding protein 15-like isoform X2 [Megalops cyprinoides]|uniref:FK506-binding protein 15-like isoform X2 n=1 Tax=Megalops cyprinoides TaxID=118141 RepID=UPI00186530FC|nr:FK506-binding protein 15-like isoform X2 [Megalops cyprinoides]
MFAADDEDGDFLSPTGGAKLASLFGLDQAASQGNESFQYTAPKQPKKSSANAAPATQKAAPPSGAPTVLYATAVHAYRYVNGQYLKQGKLGAAVLGSHANREYKILIYASQQKQVTAARIHPGFLFTVQPSNYCTFYDDQRQNWSVMFESEKAVMDFCKEVCVAKGNSAPSLDVVVVQDLVLGEGQAVENGDTLEVAYTGWLLHNHSIGQMFDSNLNKEKLLRVKLGAGKVIKGWEEGMQGMKKGGRRLLMVPPNLGYGSQGVPNRVPSDSTLIFETEIRRVKFAKDSGSDRISGGSRDSAASSPAPSVENPGPDASAQPPTAVPPKPGDLPLRAKSNSLSEQFINPDATKAKLISRMAKMGQPMLPFLAGAVSSQPDSSDSEMEDPSVSRLRENPAAPSPQPVQISAAPPVSAQAPSYPLAGVPVPSAALLPVSMATANSQSVVPGSAHAFQPYSYTQSSIAPAQLQPVGQMYPSQTVSYQGDVTSFLMTEARQHNTEIRLAVGKVADKVDQLASKVDDLQKQGGLSLGLSNVSMETAMIMHNIQRIIQENECLKKEVFEKSSRIEEQNRKIGELINQNQRYMEQSNLLMEQRNDSLKSTSEHNQTRMLQAEQDKVRLTEELASSTARVSQLQLEATAHQQKAMELQAKLSAALQEGERHCAQASSLQTQLEELKEGAERKQAQYRAEKQKRKETELKLSNTEEELQDLRTEKDNLERTLADRKRKWQAERERCDEELEEVRRSSQQELDALRAQLRRARTSTDQAAAEQLAQLQAELEAEWKGKCEQALSQAREQQARELAELSEQRDTLEHRLAQLQEKFSALKQSRDSEEQRLLEQQEQGEELQALKEKHAALQERAAAVKQQLEAHVAELERRLAEQEQADTAGEVKRVMNGVFHSLRGEFDLQETYTGQAVLGVLVNTIKNVTLQLLTRADRTPSQRSDTDGQEEEEEEDDSARAREETSLPEAQQNGKEEEEVEKEERTCSVRVVEEDMSAKGGHNHQPEREELKQEVATAEEEATQQEVRAEASQESGQEAPVTGASPSCPAEAAGTNGVKPAGSPTPDPEAETETEAEAMEQETDRASVNDDGPLKDLEVTDTAPVGPPTEPPPPPTPPQESAETAKPASLTEGLEGENGEAPFFQNAAPTKPPPPPTTTTTTEEEEEELSLKGRPPPAPLFGDDDDDDDDLDWLG